MPTPLPRGKNDLERRIDPADGEPVTHDELTLKYATYWGGRMYNKMHIDCYWQHECRLMCVFSFLAMEDSKAAQPTTLEPAPKTEMKLPECRIDPTDGELLTFDELSYKYAICWGGRMYNKMHIESYWKHDCRPASAASNPEVAESRATEPVAPAHEQHDELAPAEHVKQPASQLEQVSQLLVPTGEVPTSQASELHPKKKTKLSTFEPEQVNQPLVAKAKAEDDVHFPSARNDEAEKFGLPRTSVAECDSRIQTDTCDFPWGIHVPSSTHEESQKFLRSCKSTRNEHASKEDAEGSTPHPEDIGLPLTAEPEAESFPRETESGLTEAVSAQHHAHSPASQPAHVNRTQVAAVDSKAAEPTLEPAPEDSGIVSRSKSLKAVRGVTFDLPDEPEDEPLQYDSAGAAMELVENPNTAQFKMSEEQTKSLTPTTSTSISEGNPRPRTSTFELDMTNPESAWVSTPKEKPGDASRSTLRNLYDFLDWDKVSTKGSWPGGMPMGARQSPLGELYDSMDWDNIPTIKKKQKVTPSGCLKEASPGRSMTIKKQNMIPQGDPRSRKSTDDIPWDAINVPPSTHEKSQILRFSCSSNPEEGARSGTTTYDLPWHEVNVASSTHDTPEDDARPRTTTYDLPWDQVDLPSSAHEESHNFRLSGTSSPEDSARLRTNTYDLPWDEINVPASAHEDPEKFRLSFTSIAEEDPRPRTTTFDLDWADPEVTKEGANSRERLLTLEEWLA
eukprot:gnl/MRDRNA2_/MRDRNA2_69360_c0_seq1.p1 gnl/MRDRNA2_/MRDRNA2_69360_c0~~gnl/MRDRNA2_/MRDRNA2_69360_c0_seq1.p1  ORF type:complete len:831 (+),score=170.62 gnl/MRDRNA2_/MRDRNA2_69360_c0_seq1:292-2493(+)